MKDSGAKLGLYRENERIFRRYCIIVDAMSELDVSHDGKQILHDFSYIAS